MGWATTKDGNIKWFTKRFKLGVEECSINVTKMNKEDDKDLGRNEGFKVSKDSSRRS